jgi:hypothetical protein
MRAAARSVRRFMATSGKGNTVSLPVETGGAKRRLLGDNTAMKVCRILLATAHP